MDEETKSNNSDIINLESESNSDSYSELESNSEPENSDSQESPESPESSNSQELMKIDYSYPDPADPELQLKLYKKREFYYHATKQRPDINDYNDIKEYRDNICDRHFGLHEHQAMLGNFINPNTPYKGVVVFHGLGSGKCISKNMNVIINNDYVNIANIWKMCTIKNTSFTRDDNTGQWIEPYGDLYVYSVDSNGFMINKKVKYVYREKVNTKLRRITTNNGKIVEITDAHKLLKFNGWENKLYINDTIYTTPNITNINAEKTPILSRIVKIEYFDYDDWVYDLEIDEYHNYVAQDIICHNTCVGVSIAEKFKPMVQKYGTKIIILVGGPIIKENWKHHLIKCTGETYLKYQDKSVYIEQVEESKQEKNALIQALQYYKFMSYKSFYKHVIGEKITEKATQGKAIYRKTEEGEFERDISVDRIYNLNNTLVIVDEAHNLTGNAYGEALKYIIKNSVNLKVVLMSGTPMKNLGSDIVELVNFIRPQDSQIEKDMIFSGVKGHLLEFKEGGLEYLKTMMRGYISHVRGADPLTYATRIDKGVKPEGLLFTKVIKCFMEPFQLKTYMEAEEENKEDSLDRKAEAVANFVFPGLSSDRKELIGYYAGEGLNLIKNQLKINGELINKKLSQQMFGNEDEKDLIYLSQDGKIITGKILKMPFLKYFSTKFYRAVKKINRLVWGKKGVGTAFIYSNLVKVGISLFNEILIQNGYLEYQDEVVNYQITPDTVCYFCGMRFSSHKSETNIEYNNKYNNDIKSKLIKKIGDSDSSTEYNPKQDSDSDSDSDSESNQDSESNSESKTKTKIQSHKFYPATFITITGKSSEESLEAIPEDKMNIIKNVFNKIDNKDGRNIKFVLGSRVMNEGTSLANVKEVHILDAYFNFGRIDQVIGRAIRWCSHHKLMSENNVYPLVNVYKYVVAIKDKLSTEEELYKKAELKYLLVKKIERSMKEVAIDCPLNIHANMFKEEIEKYKNCGENEKNSCPVFCDYTKCNYKCDNDKLNAEYYDPSRNIYKKISKNNLDYSTFTHGLARDEIDYAKDKIKEMYITGYTYTLKDILEYIKNTYDDEKRELFDEFFVFKALDELIPFTENDFNNFKDTVIDKHNRAGYLIYINKYYIFQPFDQNEDVPMYYRTNVTKHITHQLSLYNYLKTHMILDQLKDKDVNEKNYKKGDEQYYNFDDTLDYYDNREEYEFVGFVDKEISRKKTKTAEEMKDVFKLREKRSKILEKKRATGIPSFKGAVCFSSKSKKYLDKVANKIGIDTKNIKTRTDMCNKIEQRMLYLEKYSTDKDKNKYTYIMIPFDHPVYKFPYNLEDRVKYTIDKIKKEFGSKITIKTTTQNKKNVSYLIHIKDSEIKNNTEFIKKLGGEKTNNEWTITIE